LRDFVSGLEYSDAINWYLGDTQSARQFYFSRQRMPEPLIDLRQLGPKFTVSKNIVNAPMHGGLLTGYFAQEEGWPGGSYFFQYYEMPTEARASQLFSDADSTVCDFYGERDRDPHWPKVRWFMARSMPQQGRELAMKSPEHSSFLRSPKGQKLMDCQGGTIAIWQDGRRVNKICVCLVASGPEEDNLRKNMNLSKEIVYKLLGQLTTKAD
jgi:hypothetical protein